MQTMAQTTHGGYLGFDRNDYPGDAAWPSLARRFAFAGYWLNDPPGANSNGWLGKRQIVRASGMGFLLLVNGRLDKEIQAAGKHGQTPEALGKADAALAIEAAVREGFPKGSVIFLDQEEGGRMLPEQSGYLLAWTEAVAATAYRPGVYASGQPVPDDPGTTITTAQDIRQQVKAKGLHEVAIFVAQDACPPSNGCSVDPWRPAARPARLHGRSPRVHAAPPSPAPAPTPTTPTATATLPASPACSSTWMWLRRRTHLMAAKLPERL
jgi:hypothetical protein